MTFWKGERIREMGLKGRRTFLPLRLIKTGIWGQAWGTVLWSAFHNDKEHDRDQRSQHGAAGHWFYARSLKSDFPCAPGATRPGTHAVVSLCIHRATSRCLISRNWYRAYSKSPRVPSSWTLNLCRMCSAVTSSLCSPRCLLVTVPYSNASHPVGCNPQDIYEK